MASKQYFGRTVYNVDTGNWFLVSNSPGGFTVTDSQGDEEFELGDTLTFGGNTGTYVGTVNYLGTIYPVMSNGVQVTIIGVAIPSNYWPTTGNFTIVEQNILVCFCAGTLIETPNGDVAVECLHIGDKVLTSTGNTVAIRWIGRKTLLSGFGLAERLSPVCIGARSLGKGLPYCDLRVTADHGMLLDGVICHASALVNGSTIRRIPLSKMGERFTVYHIETEAHEIIFANGAPSETFIDNVSRRAFDNYAEFETLYGNVTAMEELPYPRVMSIRQLPERIRMKLGDQAAEYQRFSMYV